jgi:hypothetical protein
MPTSAFVARVRASGHLLVATCAVPDALQIYAGSHKVWVALLRAGGHEAKGPIGGSHAD